MIALWLIGVISLFLYLVISDQRNDIRWNLTLAIFWPAVLAFIAVLGLLVYFGLHERSVK
jgi:hypothetical protein